MADFTACKLLLNKVDLNIQYIFFVVFFFSQKGAGWWTWAKISIV